MAALDSLADEDEADDCGLYLDDMDLAAIGAELQEIADRAITMAALHPGCRPLAHLIRLALDSIADIAQVYAPRWGNPH